jgi:hypothetical protein
MFFSVILGKSQMIYLSFLNEKRINSGGIMAKSVFLQGFTGIDVTVV